MATSTKTKAVVKDGNGTQTTNPLNTVRDIPVSDIVPNPNQPRQTWTNEKDEEGKTSLERLGQSIKEQGVLQPIIVTPKNGKFMIICGERRYQATKKHTDLKVIPCIIKEVHDDRTMLELSVTENLQREDLTPVDQAKAYKVLLDKCGYTVRSLAKKLGLSPAGVSQKLSILKLTPELQKDIHDGKLSETQGTVIAQAVSKKPVAEKPKAMKDIHERIQKARETKPKLDTKDVKTIAKAVAAKNTTAKPAIVALKKGKKGSPQKPSREESKPATPAEKKTATSFLKAVVASIKSFKSLIEVLKDKAKRERFCEVLLLTKADTEAVNQLSAFLTRIREDLAEAKRKVLLTKHS